MTHNAHAGGKRIIYIGHYFLQFYYYFCNNISLMELNITETFASVQGETSFTGMPTLFIRLAACNLRCTWCDTPYSFGRGEKRAIASLVEEAEQLSLPCICVTGGEPLLQKEVHSLMEQLCDREFTVSIETGGSLPIAEIDARVHIILDIKCPGSGMAHKNRWDNLALVQPKDEVKFVILNREDYEYAKGVCHHHRLFERGIPVLLSPVHGVMNAQELVKWILEDKLNVRLNMQIHKFIWSPETKGV